MSQPSASASLQDPANGTSFSLDTLSPWHQEQFERHLGYASSLGLSPDHARRYARQQLRATEAARTALAPAPGQTPQ